MNLNEYQKLAQRTSATIGADKIKNGCLGLIGETGEIVDALKKWLFQSGENPPFPKEKFIKEMGDVLWYCAEVASGMGWEFGSVMSDVEGCECAINYDIELLSVAISVSAHDAYLAFILEKDHLPPRDCLRMVFGLLKELCRRIHTSIDEVAHVNIEKLKKRYPDGFDPERSMHRPEYQNSEEGNGGSTEGMLFNARNHLV